MKTFSIRWKFITSSFGVLLSAVLIISIVVTFILKKDLGKELILFRQIEIGNTKDNLKSYVDVAIAIAEKANSEVKRGEITLDQAKKGASQQIEQMRWDGGVGYIWINDTGVPVPRMIMHPTVPELNGQILDDPKYNCALGQKKNLFVAMVDVSKDNGEGYVDYLWPKPSDNGLTVEQPKLSYVRHYEPFGWIIGTGKYIDDIDAAVTVKESQTAGLISKLTLSITIISLFLLFVAFFPLMLAARRITTPITQCIDFAGRVEKGDLSGFVNVTGRDETGALATALNNMVTTMRQILSDVYQHSALVVMVSNTLAASSDQMAATSKQVSEQSNSVAAAAEQVASNISSVSTSVDSVSDRSNSIAASTNEMAEHVTSVAAAVEEMSSSFKSVARHCSDAQLAAAKNLESSDLASTQINELMEAAKNIGAVISLIDQITDQTKLLALNATIEAARAGEAGKGFSVVANEVKELAGQTAKATETISARIVEMQKKTSDVVTMIQEVSIKNQELNEINTSIASAVEEQSMTSAEIAETIAGTARGSSQVSKGVQEVTGAIRNEIRINIREASLGVTEVSSNIQNVDKAVRMNAATSVGNVAFAREMAKIATELRQSFGRFLLGQQKFDIGMVKAAHIAWKLHLESMLNKGTEIAPEEIPDHTQCDFGKLLASVKGNIIKSHKAYPEMTRHHEKIHDLAHQIANLHLQGKQQQAQELMNEFNRTSSDLFAALDKIYAE